MGFRKAKLTGMNTAVLDDLLTVTEAAEELGLTTHRVREFIRERRLWATQKGPLYFISREALDNFSKIERRVGKPLGYRSGKS